MTQRGGVAALGLLLAASAPAATAQSPTPYANRATETLVAAARARHLHQDSLVRAYQATVTTRIDVSAGRSRFARQFPLIAHETQGRLTWRRPNDLRLDVRGSRSAAALRDVQVQMGYDRPWFVPRALGDSIRLMGVPETAALHPLAPGADRFYRYSIVDSVVLHLPGRTVRAIGIDVTPAHLAPSMIAGILWVDADAADVVRLQGTFLGEYLWDAPDSAATPKDSADARKDNRRAQRIVTVQADLEYALHENRFWMPYRQTLTMLIEIDLLVRGAMPVRALTTFSDYEFNADAPIVFADVPDSALRNDGRTFCSGAGLERCPRREQIEQGFLRTGTWDKGRWEVRVPPRDSLAAFGWSASLALELDAEDEERIRQTIADLSRQAEDLPRAWMGRRVLGLDWERLADVARFNRVQGLSLGAGLMLRPGPAFTTLEAGARFGLADERLTGSLAWRREAPDGAFEIRAHRSVLEAEPWTRGQSVGNTFNAVLAGHDDADYYLALGGEARYVPYRGLLEDVELAVGFERHRSMATASGSPVNDFLGGSGFLPANRPVAPGDFVRARVAPHRRLGAVAVRAGVEALVGDSTGGRAWIGLRAPFRLAGRSGALSLRSAYAVGDTLPQLFFRVGGPATVRGYDYGVRAGRGGWSAQLDLALTRRWLVAPVIFGDVGDTFDGPGFDPLVGVGGGVSLLGGWMRLNGSVGVNPKTDFRFDLLFGAPR
jgi:hypothetical protein